MTIGPPLSPEHASDFSSQPQIWTEILIRFDFWKAKLSNVHEGFLRTIRITWELANWKVSKAISLNCNCQIDMFWCYFCTREIAFEFRDRPLCIFCFAFRGFPFEPALMRRRWCPHFQFPLWSFCHTHLSNKMHAKVKFSSIVNWIPAHCYKFMLERFIPQGGRWKADWPEIFAEAFTHIVSTTLRNILRMNLKFWA